MAARFFTRGISLVFLLFGVFAFVPQLNGPANPELPADDHVRLHFENLFGHLPMNYLLAVLFIAIGAFGIWESLKTRTSRLFDRGLFVGSLVLMVVSLCPSPISDGFGFLPLYGWMTGLFLATAMFTFYPAFFDGEMPASATEPVFHRHAHG